MDQSGSIETQYDRCKMKTKRQVKASYQERDDDDLFSSLRNKSAVWEMFWIQEKRRVNSQITCQMQTTLLRDQILTHGPGRASDSAVRSICCSLSLAALCQQCLAEKADMQAEKATSC